MSQIGLVSAPVEALAEAFDGVLQVRPAELPGPLALEDTRALLRLKEQLDAHLLERLRDVEVRQLHELDALPTIGTWVAAQTTSVDRGMVALARRLDRLAVVGRELRSGRLSMQAAQRIGTAVERVRSFLDRPDGLIDGLPAEDVLEGVIGRGVPMLVGEAFGGLDDDDPRLLVLLDELAAIQASGRAAVERVEAAFVALGVRVEGGLLRGCLEQLVDALLPQQLEERAEQTHDERGLALLRNESGHGGRLEADLDDETFELVHASLAAQMANDPENVADTAAAADLRAQGVDPYGVSAPAGAPRSMLARRHDALAGILRAFLGSGFAGVRDKAVPHVLVRVGLDGLNGAPGALPAVGGSGRSLPRSLAQKWFCDSAVTRFVVGLGNKVIEMSHTVRTIKTHERKAKLVETGGRCQAAGCAAPPGTPLIPHHPEAYARSQITSFYDTVMLCDNSHQALHVGGKTLRLRDGRLLSPDGWIPQIHAA